MITEQTLLDHGYKLYGNGVASRLKSADRYVDNSLNINMVTKKVFEHSW